MKRDLILTKSDLFKLNLMLTKIIDSARIDCCIVINKSGRLITYQSESSEYDKTSLAALISGIFASSSSVANILEEDEFTSMLQEGKKKHIYVFLLDDNTIIACIFDKRTTVEKIKTFIEKYRHKLTEALTIIYNNVGTDEFINLDMSQK